MSRALIGSVSDSVIRYAHCPVLVVRKERWYVGASLSHLAGARTSLKRPRSSLKAQS